MRRWVALLVGVTSLACASGAPQPQPIAEPVPVPDPEPAPSIKGKLERIVVPHGRDKRVVWLHVPKGARKDAPLPLVVVFHGGGDGRRIAEWFARWFDREVVLAFPNARAGKDDDPSWEGIGRGDDSRGDIEFAQALVDQLRRSAPVDKDEVYATGFASGAFMTWQVACWSAHVFRGFAPVADTLPRELSQDCPTVGGPHPLLLVAGTEDRISLWSGRDDAVSVMDSVGLWLAKNRCDEGSEKIEELPDAARDDGSTVKRHTWTCQGPAVSLLEVVGGGHSWPRPEGAEGRKAPPTNRDIDTADEIMRFFGLGEEKTP
jgi:polyhydroxybutyrate depolymerase